jgi:hypothetical protein
MKLLVHTVLLVSSFLGLEQYEVPFSMEPSAACFPSVVCSVFVYGIVKWLWSHTFEIIIIMTTMGLEAIAVGHFDTS